MTDATELDEAAIRERAEFWASRDPENTQRGLYDRHAVAFAREVVALLAALDEARADFSREFARGMDLDTELVDVRIARDKALARAEAAEGALAAVRALADIEEARGCHYRHQQGETDECNACTAARVTEPLWKDAALATPTTTEETR